MQEVLIVRFEQSPRGLEAHHRRLLYLDRTNSTWMSRGILGENEMIPQLVAMRHRLRQVDHVRVSISQ